MGGCPRLIVSLLFKDEDDNHGDDDDRRNLSPSGSHYVSNLEAYISFLIFQIYAAPSTLLWADGGWRRAACEWDVRRRVERWDSIQRGTIDLTFSLILILIFFFSEP